ncbi:MAG: CotH kinase family protein [Crocinitomicaceae bacterium]|nr:CotH kinase family protein [Crocinitomicaceae bacterium]
MHQLSVKSSLGLLCLFYAVMLTGCSAEGIVQNNSEDQIFFCGAESEVTEGGQIFFDDGSGRFAFGGHVVSDTAFEGSRSLRLDAERPYGMSMLFTNIEPGTYFETSIWIKNPVGRATLIASITGKSDYTLHTSQINKGIEKNGWTNYFMSFGFETPVDTLVIYPFSSGESHYFDNLEIKRFATRPAMNDSLRETALQIFIPDSAVEYLQEAKKNAIEKGLISSDLKGYVAGSILQGPDSIPIELRLKGDWTDHLENGKTSYRIKTDLAFRGLTTFSIQHPQTRNYMHEWFMHRVCDLEGLLSTSYDFLPVEINGVNQGIYAIEEHFDKQLLESRNRREGPIIKIDESGFWALRAAGVDQELNSSFPYFESAMITCFKEGRTEKSEVLSGQFENAASLLWLYKNRIKNPEQILDIEKTAKFYALMDIGNIHHALVWHNMRYYYNPVTTKLEMIGFDMIPAIKPINQLIANARFEISKNPQEDETALDHHLFLNEDFRKYYTYYLTIFSSEEYLDSIFKVLDQETKTRENLLSTEFPNYHLEKDFYYEKAEFIRTELTVLDSSWDNFMNTHSVNSSPKILPANYNGLSSDFLLKDISVNAYRSQIDSTHFKLQLENFHLADVTVVGYSTKGGEDSLFMLEKPVALNRYDGVNQADQAEIILPKKPSKIHFTIANNPGVLQSKKVFSWKRPELTHPRIELEKKFKIQSPLYSIKDDTLFVKKGTHVIQDILLVPSKYVVVVEAGTKLDLIKGAAIITNNSTYLNGHPENKIVVTSSDSSSQGFIVLGAKETLITGAEFTNLGSLNYEGWNLTGALTIYEGNVHIDYTEISNNHCEDALNIIRANFSVLELTIQNTKGDAFDADFCTGTINDSRFENTGNDCIDFSGSQVEISRIKIRNSGDKGISSGEKSTLTATNIDIDGALTAFASKDGSVLMVTQSSAKNCEVGAALYRKKPEYPFSKMSIESTTFSQIDKPALIEKGAVLTYNKANYFGYTTFDIEAMYARFEK